MAVADASEVVSAVSVKPPGSVAPCEALVKAIAIETMS